jgi:predicted XRE-type DNA-binding protein
MAKKEYVVGSGNVFADLGHPRPAEALAKAELARKISATIARRGLTQAAAAEVLEIDQPKVSALTRGRLAGFSLDRLVRFLVLLGSDVEIVVKPASRTGRRARVMVA